MKPRLLHTLSALISASSLVAFVALAILVTSGTTASFDNTVRLNVHATASSILTALATGLSVSGRLAVLIPATIVIALGLLLAHRRSGAISLSAAMLGAMILNWVLKLAIHRPRPQPFFGVDPESFSFPSGHVLFAACFYGSLALLLQTKQKLSPIIWLAATAMVFAIGWSRVYLGVHYPTDVAAGLLVATSWMAGLYAVGVFKRPQRN